MVIMIMFDDNTYVAVAPENFTLSKLDNGSTGLGWNTQVPVVDDKNQPVFEADGKTPRTVQKFRTLITYPVALADLPPVVVTPPAVLSKKKSAKKK